MKCLLFLSLLLLCGSETQAKRITIPRNHDGGWYKPKLWKVSPGDTIELDGDYAYWNIDSLNGTPEKPIVFINKKGVRSRVGINNTYSAIFYNSSNYVIDGSGDSTIPYGIVFGPKGGDYNSLTLTPGNSTNYEVKHVEIVHGQVGIYAAPPFGITMKKIKIHHNWIHDMRNPSGYSCEAMYLGNTSINVVANKAHFENIEIHHNLCEDLAGDGIQLANAQGYKIYNNVVKKYGISNFDDQRSGIIVGGNSWGVVKNNVIENGTGSGIEIFGCRLNTVTGNTIRNTATSKNQPDAIYIEKKGAADCGPLRVIVVNNTIIGAARYGIHNVNALNNPATTVNKDKISGNRISLAKVAPTSPAL